MNGPLSRDELAGLVAGGEDSFTEFKEPASSSSDIAKEMCAFSNAAGGRILVGVDDDGEIVGDSEWDEERVMNVARTALDPPIIPTYQRMVWSPGIEVAIIGVPLAAEKPYARRSGESLHYYMRVGSTSRQASREELIRITQASGAVASDLRPVLGATPEDLDGDLLTRRFQDLRTVRYSELTESERRRLLVDAEILHPQTEGPTIAGLLCFGVAPQQRLPYALVSCAAYAGNVPQRELQDKVDAAGRIDQQIGVATAFIDNNVARSSVLRGVQRQDAPRPSLETFRELIANAVAHRHYGIGGPVQLRVFANRIEVVSPGGLPNGVTPAAMRLGLSVRRNQFLIQHLAQLGIVDAIGRGVALMFEEAAARGLPPPELHAEEAATRVVIPID